MKNLIKSDYKKIEKIFYNELVQDLGTDLVMYCLTGSLSRNEVIPGWSDIDVVLVIRDYNTITMKKIGECIKRNSREIKIGSTIYCVDEFNSGNFNDPKTNNIMELLYLGKIKPTFISILLKIKRPTKKLLINCNGIDVSKELHTLKRELISPKMSEQIVYKRLTNIIRSLMIIKTGKISLGYKSVWSDAKNVLKGFNFPLLHPLDIMNEPTQLNKRIITYFQILEWLVRSEDMLAIAKIK